MIEPAAAQRRKLEAMRTPRRPQRLAEALSTVRGTGGTSQPLPFVFHSTGRPDRVWAQVRPLSLGQEELLHELGIPRRLPGMAVVEEDVDLLGAGGKVVNLSHPLT